jgi:hypothetical protein
MTNIKLIYIQKITGWKIRYNTFLTAKKSVISFHTSIHLTIYKRITTGLKAIKIQR